MTQNLRFAPPSENSMHEYEPITLPNIEPYIPAGTDPDAATALTALYRSHCTSLVDAIRFVKQKTFFHLFTSFHGTLTMPVQKLFAHASIAPWIEECDFVMYQKMIRLLGHLTLEVVPQQILDTLHAISERLVPHIQNSFQGQPAHVIQAKVAPATLFAGLLDRMCRVNLTAHAAANMLSHPPNRDQMYEDWITMVRLRKVAENIPTRAMDDVVTLLLSELRDLLDPVSVPWEIESATPYGDIIGRNVHQRDASIHADSSTENVLDRWVNFLVSIPGRFPYASPEDIIWCVDRVGTAVMRDLTIKSGQSFGAWWVTKCWIDEMISFMAEKGGFMEYKTSNTSRNEAANGQSFPNIATSQHPTQYNSGVNDEFSHQQHGNGSGHGIIIPGPMDTTSQAAMNAAAGHDDSGIGIRTPDDEFSMSKFGFSDGPLGTPTLDGSMQLSGMNYST
jgi:regulatory factor X